MRGVKPWCVVLLLPALACVDRTLGNGDAADGTQASTESGSSSGTETESGGETETEFGGETETESGGETETDSETETGETETETETETGPDLCGNGIVEFDEECDDGNSYNGDECVAGCLLATCGDHFKYWDLEECDDGNANDDDMCTNSCQYNTDPLCDDQRLPILSVDTRDDGPDGPEGVQLCDRLGAPNQSPDWVGPGWYRFGEWGNEVPFNDPPEDYSCGGTAGGWLNSPYPALEDGPTDVDICFAFGMDECAWSVAAVLINCWDQPNVVWLPEVPDCDLRYCMGEIIPP